MTTPETEIEPDLESIPSSFGNFFATCWGCMADFFIRAFGLIRDTYFTVQNWILNSCTNCFCDDDETPPEKNLWSTSRSTPLRTKVTQMPPSQMSPGVRAQPTSPMITIAPQTHSPSDSTQLNQPATLANQGSASTTVRSTISSPNLPISSAKVQAKEISRHVIEPPKIDFVETGSIFGDRKRHGSEQSLMMENGRFRSPGLSKTIIGPNGRAIRVSFVTGFPSIKSVESTRSTISKNWPKKSNESMPAQQQQFQPQSQPQQPTQQPAQQLAQQQQEKEKEKESNEKLRKTLSGKSYKSSKSIQSITERDDNYGKVNSVTNDEASNK